MTLSKYLKYTTLGIVGFVVGAELYLQCTKWLQQKLKADEESEITEIVYTVGPGNYNTRLTRNITFVREPVQHATEVLVNLILSAEDTIYVAMYIFTSDPLARALITARNKGIDVKCVVDASMENANSSKIRILHKAGIPVKIHDAKTLHLKLCIIDVPFGKKKKKTAQTDKNATLSDIPIDIPESGIVVTGSLNWTREALMSNEENFIVTSNPELCQSSAKKFHEVWNDSRLY
jgi:phosphatidylserine/phosphatidylglycerophosphate/cardiolipin synthase-like enzyme